MSVAGLIERFSAAVQAGIADWRPWREEILAEHHAATTERDRVLCLQLMDALMGSVERNNIDPHNLATFRKTRREQYCAMLIQEAVIGRSDGQIDPIMMASITSREVRDGRMTADDEFHQLALDGAQRGHPSLRPRQGIRDECRRGRRVPSPAVHQHSLARYNGRGSLRALDGESLGLRPLN